MVSLFASIAKIGEGEDFSPEELQKRLILFRQSVVLFNLHKGGMRSLARTMVNAEARTGTQLLSQGRANNYFFILRSGRCRVVYQTAPGHGIPIAILNPGDCFGEGIFMGEEVSNMSVVASSECTFLAITKEAMEEALPSDSLFWSDMRSIREQRQLLLESVLRNDLEADSSSGKIIAIYSPKGGSGKSVVAVNLAAELALANSGGVVLLDLALPFNHDAVMAGVVPTDCLARVDIEGEDFDEAVLAATTRHASGLSILSSTLRAEEAEKITPKLIHQTLNVLTNHFQYVIVDAHDGLSETALAVFDTAHQIVLLGTYELTAIKDTEEVLELFDSVLRIAVARVVLAFNKRQEKPAMSKADIEHSLERTIEVELPFVGGALEAASMKGTIMVLSDRRGAFTKAIGELAKLVRVAPVSSMR